MATDNNTPNAKKRDVLAEALARDPRFVMVKPTGKGFIIGGQSPKRLWRCAFEGCPKTSEQPFADGWADLAGWGSGVPDGLYCREHADALEAVHEAGGLDDLDDDKDA